jgi:hypothetical protein
MSNSFDSTYYPTSIPSEFVAGDRWAWKRTDLSADYGSGYTLSYELTLSTGAAPITLTATLSGDEYLMEIAAATTAAYTAGNYQWVSLITRDSDSERIRIGYGTLEVKPDPAVSTADNRTHAATVLDSIEAVIEGRASKDQESYSIAGRSLSRTPIPELLILRDRYKAEVKREEQAEKVRQGMNTGNQILVRMR